MNLNMINPHLNAKQTLNSQNINHFEIYGCDL